MVDSDHSVPNLGSGVSLHGHVERAVENEGNGEQATLRPPLYNDWESLGKSSAVSLVEEKRDKWGNQWEFIFTCLSTAVGLGNVWRFPFTAYDNGGGAFLMPFLLILFVLGTPLYFLEMSVGQFCTRGPIGIWDMAPACRGVGWAFLFIAACTVLYYVSILAICTIYLVYSFSSVLPWKDCYFRNGKSDWYATAGRKIFKTLECKGSFGEYRNFSNLSQTLRISNSELFFQYAVIKQEDNMDNGLGTPSLEMSLALYFVWFLVFLNVMLGTKTSGKCAYFTALFPYFVLITLFIKAMTLDGAMTGISYFFQAEWSKVLDIQVWFKAVGQCFFSLGVGYGVITTYGSYNPTKRKVYKDVIFICLADTLTSILAGATVFAILGVLAKVKNEEMHEVTTGGNGLAFVSYPEILLYFGGWAPQVFSVLFFLMLISLGIGSGSSYITAICGTIYDRVPWISNSKRIRIMTAGLICLIFCTLGLIFATPAGNYMVDFFDLYSSGFVVYGIVIFQIAGIAYIYGMKNFTRDLQFMFGGRGYRLLYLIFQIWGYVIPLFLTGILGYVLYDAAGKPLQTYDGDFPLPVTIAGWILFSLIVLIVPVFAVGVYKTRKSRIRYKRFMASVTPNHHWGPKHKEEKEEWEDMKRGFDGDTALWKRTFGKWCGRGNATKPEQEADVGLPTPSRSGDVSQNPGAFSGMGDTSPENVQAQS